MDFLAVSPGVHSIDVLTLTDTETGFSMNLRYALIEYRMIISPITLCFSLSFSSVLDVVVHDPND